MQLMSNSEKCEFFLYICIIIFMICSFFTLTLISYNLYNLTKDVRIIEKIIHEDKRS